MGARILEDHRDLVPVPAQRGSAQRHDVGAVEADLPGDLGAARQQPVDRPRGHRLARAGLADQPDRLAWADAERDVAQDGPLHPFHPEPDGQALDLEQRPA